MTVEERVAKTKADEKEFYKDINRIWDDNFFDDCEKFREEHEELAVAYRISMSDEWNPEDCRRLCELAEIEDEWDAADGETFEQVVFKAAELLNVKVN
jgi:hypothetical protein